MSFALTCGPYTRMKSPWGGVLGTYSRVPVPESPILLHCRVCLSLYMDPNMT